VPSDVNGINFVLDRPRPSIAFTATMDGERISLDQFQVASAATLVALRAKEGVMRLSSSEWRLAAADVAHGLRWGMAIEYSEDTDSLLFYLDDTKRPGAIQVADYLHGVDGQLVASASTALRPPSVGVSGDEEVDQHLAIVLTMIRENGGTLPGSLSEFTAAAYDLYKGHAWRTVPGFGDGEHQIFYLSEPHTPPSKSPDIR